MEQQEQRLELIFSSLIRLEFVNYQMTIADKKVFASGKKINRNLLIELLLGYALMLNQSYLQASRQPLFRVMMKVRKKFSVKKP